ncbi:AMP-binding protein [Azospirillum doebereinerae]
MSYENYRTGLEKNSANHVPLTPLSFLDRTADVYPDRVAVVHGSLTQTWAETRNRCRRLASALIGCGIQRGDTVSILCPNTPAMLEAHYGVPWAGAVLNAVNYRLDAEGIAYILEHGQSKALLVDREFAALAAKALKKLSSPILVIRIDDHLAPEGAPIGDVEYEEFLLRGDPGFRGLPPEDEWDAIGLNYTSGTTGDPKGVVPSHRGTYVMSLAQVVDWGLPRHAVYLWTLPMFHANGWCFTWAVTAIAGTHVCLRRVAAAEINAAIERHGVTHFCAAPIVLATLVQSAEQPDSMKQGRRVKVLTAGSPPPATVLKTIQERGFLVDHVFGMTEISGTPISCAWHEDWSDLSLAEQALLRARQGVRCALLSELTVMDPNTWQPVPQDGKTVGEIMIRGNTLMKGYYRNAAATARAFAEGWLNTGDLAVIHPNGYMQITDRLKDIIISGGENISSVEVEDVIHRHPAVLHAAVVARPDEKWGETPCAFVELKADAEPVTEDDLIAFCRQNLAHYKCPRNVFFTELPKTATGKIQKFRLREVAGSRNAITNLAILESRG